MKLSRIEFEISIIQARDIACVPCLSEKLFKQGVCTPRLRLTKKCKILSEIKVLNTLSWQDINQEKATAILSHFNVESL